MHKKSIYFNKTLVIGIIILLLGMSVTPIINGSIKLKNKIINNYIIDEIENIHSQSVKKNKNGNDRYPSFGSYPEGCNYVYFLYPPRELEWEYNNEDFNGTLNEFRLLASDNTNHTWNLNKFELHINGVNFSNPDTQSFYRRHLQCYEWEIIWNNLNLNCSGEILFEVLYLECTWIEYKGDYDNDGDETFHYSHYNPRSYINGTLDGDHIYDSDKAYLVYYIPPSYNPPDPPSKPTGTSSGYICIDHNYSTSTTDPNGLNVSYGWDWNGDQKVDEWTDWYESNDTCIISHNWSKPNKYKISVKAINTNDEEGNWSSRLNVTIKNHPPYPPSNPNPPDEEPEVPVNTILCWSGGDPDGNTVYYDVYLEASDSSPDILVSDDQTGTSYDPGTLSYSTTYYWKIKAYDGEFTETGPVWDFTTPSAPPNKPNTPSGPTTGYRNTPYTYATSTTDPDGDNVKYGWDWNGDYTVDEWTSWYNSGEQATRTHSFSSPIHILHYHHLDQLLM